MTEHKRSKLDRRYGDGTRNGDERRDTPSDDWQNVEKRRKDERRHDQRRTQPDRRNQD